MPYAVEYRDWDGTTRTFGAHADENDAIVAAAAHYAATGNRAVAIATAPVEPDELALEWTLHQWTDADIPADDDAPVGAQPRPCGHGLTAGPHETICPWCVAEAEADERRSFYPF